jgi:hypothetical protein
VPNRCLIVVLGLKRRFLTLTVGICRCTFRIFLSNVWLSFLYQKDNLHAVWPPPLSKLFPVFPKHCIWYGNFYYIKIRLIIWRVMPNLFLSALEKKPSATELTIIHERGTVPSLVVVLVENDNFLSSRSSIPRVVCCFGCVLTSIRWYG